MRVAVVVTPGQVVLIPRVSRGKSLQGDRNILDEAGLVLDGGDGPG